MRIEPLTKWVKNGPVIWPIIFAADMMLIAATLVTLPPGAEFLILLEGIILGGSWVIWVMCRMLIEMHAMASSTQRAALAYTRLLEMQAVVPPEQKIMGM